MQLEQSTILNAILLCTLESRNVLLQKCPILLHIRGDLPEKEFVINNATIANYTP